MGYVNEFKTRGKSESNSLSGRKTMTPQHISSGAGKAKAKMPTVRPIRQSGYPGAVPPRFEISRDPAWRVRVVRKFRYEEAGHREAMSSASNLSNSSRHERLCGSWSDMIENLPRTGYDLAKQNGRAVSLNPAPIRQNGIRRISQPKGTPSGERFKNTLKGGW